MTITMPPQPLQLTDVLAQLPLDVVQHSFLGHLDWDDLTSFKLVSKACAQLVRQHASEIHLYGVDLQLDRDSAELSARVRTLDSYAAAREVYIEVEDGADVGGLAVGEHKCNKAGPSHQKQRHDGHASMHAPRSQVQTRVSAALELPQQLFCSLPPVITKFFQLYRLIKSHMCVARRHERHASQSM